MFVSFSDLPEQVVQRVFKLLVSFHANKELLRFLLYKLWPDLDFIFVQVEDLERF